MLEPFLGKQKCVHPSSTVAIAQVANTIGAHRFKYRTLSNQKLNRAMFQSTEIFPRHCEVNIPEQNW